MKVLTSTCMLKDIIFNTMHMADLTLFTKYQILLLATVYGIIIYHFIYLNCQ